jgi:hypothetical protein
MSCEIGNAAKTITVNVWYPDKFGYRMVHFKLNQILKTVDLYSISGLHSWIRPSDVRIASLDGSIKKRVKKYLYNKTVQLSGQFENWTNMSGLRMVKN